jgi:hypothetical protein
LIAEKGPKIKHFTQKIFGNLFLSLSQTAVDGSITIMHSAVDVLFHIRPAAIDGSI